MFDFANLRVGDQMGISGYVQLSYLDGMDAR